MTMLVLARCIVGTCRISVVWPNRLISHTIHVDSWKFIKFILNATDACHWAYYGSPAHFWRELKMKARELSNWQLNIPRCLYLRIFFDALKSVNVSLFNFSSALASLHIVELLEWSLQKRRETTSFTQQTYCSMFKLGTFVLLSHSLKHLTLQFWIKFCRNVPKWTGASHDQSSSIDVKF